MNRPILRRGYGDDAPALSTLFLRFGVLVALAGVGMGIAMGASGDFRLSSVHAHLNLLGWVSMMIYGLFYRQHPACAEGYLPLFHATCATVGLIVFTGALALKLVGPADLAHAAGLGLMLGPMLIFAGMAAFALVVFQATRAAR